MPRGDPNYVLVRDLILFYWPIFIFYDKCTLLEL